MSLNKLRIAILNKPLRARPPHDEHVPIRRRKNRVHVGAPAKDVLVAKQPHEDGRVQVRAVNHADVAGGVVEVLQALGEGREEGGEVVVVQEGLVPRRVGQLGGGEALSEVFC